MAALEACDEAQRQADLGHADDASLLFEEFFESAKLVVRIDPRQQLAYFILGNMYQSGVGTERDFEKAVQCYCKAADQGCADSQDRLGDMYYEGAGVVMDPPQAVQWYLKASSQGHVDAQYKLDDLLLILKEAADEGIPKAQNFIGDMYNQGIGTAPDSKTAVRWYRKAADQGFCDAQGNLGDMYFKGTGVKQDKTKALIWWKKAVEQGYTTDLGFEAAVSALSKVVPPTTNAEAKIKHCAS
jgi:TPR repeat protein